MKPILQIKDLRISFRMYGTGLQQKDLEVIHSLDLTVHPGEIVSVVGSSGSGKSLLAHAVLGILPDNASVSGEILYDGSPLNNDRRKTLLGTELTFIPQSVDYLDPLMRIGKQVRGTRGTPEDVDTVFARYHLNPDVKKMYPYQLSGGMVRRVLIASAVTGNPRLIVADEPTPGLDPTLAMKTLKHFRELADQGCGILLITHDLETAIPASDRIAVFYAGTTLETAPVTDFHSDGSRLRHPYSKALLHALPQNEFTPIPGTQPYAGNLPSGCLFRPRCSHCTEECKEEIPMRTLRGGEVRCIHAD